MAYFDDLDKIEKDHVFLLSEMAEINRSDKRDFTVSERLAVIRRLLEKTSYQETRFPNVSMWSKVPLASLPEDVILVSSHTDVVESIEKCSSRLNDDGLLHGTYDNLGTNAAEVILMREEDLPENIVFAFTGDEETGRCMGAKNAAGMLHEIGKKPVCIALDVTYEGFDDDRLYSLENLTGGSGENAQEFIDKIAETALACEPDGVQTFCFVRASDKAIPSKFDRDNEACVSGYMESSKGMYDEAFAYRDVGFPSASVCLPCDGSMHSESGLDVKQPVFEGYVLSLTSLLCELSHTKEPLVYAYKVARAGLVEKAGQIKTPERHYFSSYASSHIYDHDWDDDEWGWTPDYTGSSYDEEYEDEEREEALFDFFTYMGTFDRIYDAKWDIAELDDLVPEFVMNAASYDKEDREDYVNDQEIDWDYMSLLMGEKTKVSEKLKSRIAAYLGNIFDIVMEDIKSYEEVAEEKELPEEDDVSEEFLDDWI
jgi:hypothetical protein